ncbi:NERD domain-containing protein/DEAD/DEAH box helicase [Pedobacter sp. Leaf170]|uniref:NERD domain-containing protein/DEAD/DEAH box helicase n=1 Tax=Pedobacter sp. Leaf170 TaxID=2876558 RepID=UPI001E344152|nr:NERD domain-containing protein/DEAD/DEAH box helicase [Pedobacter sp. Leaf170]
MLEIRKGTAAKNYENTFFREFAANLKKMFDKYSLDGLLIANAECEVENRLQIDALLITPRAVCIIDFKNFSGKIILPKNAKPEFDFGIWKNENAEAIKGGSSINPFIQLKIQKERFIKVIGRHIAKKLPQGNMFNAFHTVRAVCFQKPIELIGKIPASEELNFFILDQQSYLETIMDIIDISDKEVLLTKESFDLFKEVFRADPFDTAEQYEPGHDFTSYHCDLDFDSLYPDQKSALAEIENFISSEEDRVFILQGTSLSGKTHLIPFIQEVAFNRQISEVKLFASSSRVANNLLKNTKMEFAGMYSYIYGGNLSLLHEEEPEREDTLNLEIVPLRKSDNMDEAIFIVDESHLVSDNYHQSVDLRFGSGKLLKDFLEFSELENTRRKLIFIGDSFQLSLGKKEESSLNPEYFKDEYGLKTMAFQLIDKGERSLIVSQALKAVDGIRLQCFNNLDFSLSENIQTLSKEEFKPQIAASLNANAHILCFTNSDAQKVNFWIKNTILKNGNEPTAGDLVIFGNNIRVEDPDQPFAEPKKVYNGQFGTIVEVFGLIEKHERLLVPLHFRKMQIRLKGAGHLLSFLSFENFRLSDKGELSKEEIISLQILLNQLAEKEIRNFVTGKYQADEELKKLLIKYEPENRKGISKLLKALQMQLRNIPSSEYYQIKNAAQLRFGWALTVHKSMSYKWDQIFFNVETGGGKTNENYFKWIYTGLIRARNKVNLINYEPINPFCKFTVHQSVPKIDHGKQLYFLSDRAVECSNKNIAEKYSFPDTKHRSALLQLFQFMENKISQNGLTIHSVSHISYQELYELNGSPGERATVSIYYNNKGQFKMPMLMKSAPKEFGEELIVLLKSENKIADFSFVKSDWRKLAYEQLNRALNEKTVSFGYIIQVPYKDTIQFHKKNEVLVIDFYYDGDGFFTSLIATSATSMEFWAEVQEILTGMKGKSC